MTRTGRGRLALAAATLALLLAGCVQPGIGGLTLVTAEAHDPGPVTLFGDVAVLGGSLSLPEGSGVRGSIHVLDGELRIDGRVDGAVNVVGGSVRLGSDAVVAGDVSVAVGSAVDIARGARVGGTVREGLVLEQEGGPDPVGFLLRTAVLALALLAVRQLAPGRVGAAAGYLERMPAACAAYGFLIGIVGLTLAVFMAFTLVLVPVALGVLAALGVLTLVGLAALSGLLGGWLARLDARLARPHVLWTAIAVSLAPTIPVAGLVIVGAALTLSLGSVGLSLQRGVPEIGTA